mgnify:FL=1
MKYYSEILRKTFDTVKELNDVETAEKEKVLAKQKEDAARTEEIKAAKEALKKAKEEYVVSLKACRENLSRVGEAEQKLVDLERKYKSLSTDFSDGVLKKAGATGDKDGDWMVRDFYNFLRKFL